MSDSASRTLQVVGSQIRVLLGGAQTGGAFTIVEDTTPPGGGPPPHVHQREDEGFVVLEGEIEVLLGDRWVRVPPGTSVFGPRGVPHTFRNVGKAPSRMIVTISPAGFEHFFAEVDRMSAGGPPTPEQLIELGAKYGLQFLPPG
jgi:mannose-6-phosphate isomerase-like protein (cupin superfamily)